MVDVKCDKKEANPLKIPLSDEQLTFIMDNFFINLDITQITEETLPLIYDEILKMCEFYKKIRARPLLEFANDLLNIIYDYIPWKKISAEQEAQEKCETETIENDCE